jgi:hypothetical protein
MLVIIVIMTSPVTLAARKRGSLEAGGHEAGVPRRTGKVF